MHIYYLIGQEKEERKGETTKIRLLFSIAQHFAAPKTKRETISIGGYSAHYLP
jgi:hypothetical protein